VFAVFKAIYRTIKTFPQTSRLTATSMTKANTTTITTWICVSTPPPTTTSPSQTISTELTRKAWVLLRSIYQHPSLQSYGHFVVLASPKPLAVATSHALAMLELDSLKADIMSRENTHDYSLIIPHWIPDRGGVNIEITPKDGILRLEVRLRIEEVDVVGRMHGLSAKSADVVREVLEMAALVGKQNSVGERRYWKGPMDGCEGMQYRRVGVQTPYPEDRDSDEPHYDFVGTTRRFHVGGEEEVPALFALGVSSVNIPVLPKGFVGSSIDGRMWTTNWKKKD
jgi:hypothetical protein